MKKRNVYKHFIKIYYIILIGVMLYAWFYVYQSLKNYELNQPEKYILNLVKKIKSNPVAHGNVKKEHAKGYKNILDNDNIKVIKVDKHYQIIKDDIPLFDVYLKAGKSVTKLGLLKYDLVELDKINPTNDKGVYYYQIIVPENFKVLIDNKEATNPTIEENKEFREINHDFYPKNHLYEIDNLNKEPKIEIINNNGEKVKFKQQGNIIENKDFYQVKNYQDVIKEPFNVLKLGEQWSLFLTNDLANGFTVLRPYLIQDSKMYKQAYNWSVGEDKGFVSAHYLKNPAFTEEEVKDCYIYNEHAFSCVIKLKKHMIVGNEEKIDILNDRFYFVYDGSWKLVDIKHVGD